MNASSHFGTRIICRTSKKDSPRGKYKEDCLLLRQARRGSFDLLSPSVKYLKSSLSLTAGEGIEHLLIEDGFNDAYL